MYFTKQFIPTSNVNTNNIKYKLYIFSSTLSPNLSNPDHTCFILKDRSLQPIAHALNIPSAIESRPTTTPRVKTPVLTTTPAQSETTLPTFNTDECSSNSNLTPKSLKRDHLNRYII